MYTRKKLFLAAICCSILLTSLLIFTLVTRHYRAETTKTKPSSRTTFRYLPLGDSYTIGESVSAEERWPNQLAGVYKPSGKNLTIVDNPSATGYTTSDLIHKELPLVAKLKPDFVTVQIGVNDYVQGVELQKFQHNLVYIIGQLKQLMAEPKNILLVTIPDYAKTPTGATYGDPGLATASIQSFNTVIINTAANTNLPVADVFGVSQLVTQDASLIAPDGLHPSGKQYSTWTSIIKTTLVSAKIPQ